MKQETKKPVALFEGKEVRRVWHNDQWYFVVNDVVEALVQTTNVSDYLKKMRQRDPEISKGWGQFVTPLSVKTIGGKQRINCSHLQGILRIIQSVPSPRAEPFKLWLAKVGQERLEEIQDPELAIARAKELYKRKGYPKDWIDKRVRGIAVRNTLTDEWRNRGVTNQFGILTDEIYKATFDMNASEYKNFKSLHPQHNLRDHMDDVEIILTMLGEATTTTLTKDRDSYEIPTLKRDAHDGGSIAGRTRRDIEQQTQKKVSQPRNFLDNSHNLPDKQDN